MSEENKNIETEVPAEETKKKTSEKKTENKKLSAEIQTLNEKLEKLQVEHDELNDKYMRMMAEYDNFRKRTAKEKEGTYTDAYFDAVGAILPIIDNVERAAGYKEADKVAEGVCMILKSFNEMLEKLSVTAYGEKGDVFDPNIHNALMHIEDESYGENVIVEVFQKGYRKEDKILRYAMVQVAN